MTRPDFKYRRWALIVILLLGLVEFGRGAWIPAKAWLSQVLLQQAWSETLATHEPHKPWPWADTRPLFKLHHTQTETSLIVMASDSGQSLAFGPGYMQGSRRPGMPGNIVISGHRDTHFQFLQSVKHGETIDLTDDSGKIQSYRVFSTQIVNAEQRQLRLDTIDEQLTLVTCHPFNSLVAGGPLRYVVSASRI